ncbi:helix-turn-helix domain-containing protein [Comamonas serinivorans]|uniref:helix-turn-helix domain-containing protein n=1 Tax=Comamonas serinivorans TaxID=1082851 RepID=UPI0012F91AE3|nr:helix-turn-helix transcriptional regulator [Comamonas serinivorans]
MPALPLSQEQKEDAQRLKAIFLAWKAERKRAGKPSGQEHAAAELGFGQSAFNQYVNGKIPINLAAAVKFSQFFGCQIEDFSPAMAAEAGNVAKAASVQPESESLDITQLSKIEAQLVLMFRDLNLEMKDEVVALTNRLHNVVMPSKSQANPWANVPPPPAVVTTTDRPTKKTSSKAH